MVRATFLEAYIGEDIGRWANDHKRSNNVVNSLIRYAAVLAILGFRPVDIFSDLRVDSGEVAVVDFGRIWVPLGELQIAMRCCRVLWTGAT